MTLIVRWLDGRRTGAREPDPCYPEGRDINVTFGKQKFCETKLDYPAPRFGAFEVRCDVAGCGRVHVVTTTGGRDDPRSIKIGCRK